MHTLLCFLMQYARDGAGVSCRYQRGHLHMSAYLCFQGPNYLVQVLGLATAGQWRMQSRMPLQVFSLFSAAWCTNACMPDGVIIAIDLHSSLLTCTLKGEQQFLD